MKGKIPQPEEAFVRVVGGVLSQMVDLDDQAVVVELGDITLGDVVRAYKRDKQLNRHRLRVIRGKGRGKQ